jgi:hypothetical protein
MSNDKKMLHIKVDNKALYGYLARKPETEQGKKSLYTKFSFYDSRLPDAANPVIVTAFGEDAKAICKACESFDKKQFIKLTCSQLAFGEVFNPKTNTSRNGIYAVATSCEAHVASSEQSSDKPSEARATNESDQPKPVVKDPNAVKAALEILQQQGIDVAVNNVG